jgi:replicative DNA helicase
MSTVPFNRRTRPLPSDIANSLPWSKDAERSVLGAILLDNTALPTVTTTGVEARRFFLKENQQIFLAMQELAGNGRAIDLVTLTDYLGRVPNVLEAAGGVAYVSALADGMPKVSNVGEYCAIMLEKYRLRQLVAATDLIQELALEGITKSEDLVTQLDSFTKTLANGNGKSKLIAYDLSDVVTMDVSPVDYAMYPIFPIKGIGMIYAGRGVGKTFFALEMAYCVALGLQKCFLW